MSTGVQAIASALLVSAPQASFRDSVCWHGLLCSGFNVRVCRAIRSCPDSTLAVQSAGQMPRWIMRVSLYIVHALESIKFRGDDRNVSDDTEKVVL